MTMKSVQLSLAFMFECPDCGSINFVEAEIHEFTRQEQVEMEPLAGELPKTGEWVTTPNGVICEKCYAEFEVK